MFSFFKKKGKAEPETPERARTRPTEPPGGAAAGAVDAPRHGGDVTNEKTGTLRKDVVNLLIPETDYGQRSGVGALLQIMAGKRRRSRRKARADSCRVSPPRDAHTLQRRNSEGARAPPAPPTPPTPHGNTRVEPRRAHPPADCARTPATHTHTAEPGAKQQHVSLVYVTDEAELEGKRHAEALLREIARTIHCDVGQVDEERQMGGADSKQDARADIAAYRNGLQDELHQQLRGEHRPDQCEEKEDKADAESLDSPAHKKKSNLKLPKSDTEGCSDDDRSDCGKKRVTFRKHVIFDDGEQQTDDEMNSSFESLSSEEEESEYLEDAMPDNDELLGGVVVPREEEVKTVINVPEVDSIKIKVECFDDGLKRISSDNSDSGFIEMSERNDEATEEGDGEVSEVSEESEVSEGESGDDVVEVVGEETVEEFVGTGDTGAARADENTLVTQESKFQSQVAALTDLADTRYQEAERARELILSYRKEIEAKDQEIEQLKCDLAAAYKESELVRQRSRSLEEELTAARSCSADLAEQLQRRNDESIRQLRSELEEALMLRAELESRVLILQREKERLEQEKELDAQKAQEALSAAEASSAKWRAAHEAARTQAASRAERILADCEWKMRELERRAREAEKEKKELSQTVERLQNPPHLAELQQLRGLVGEQQYSLQSLSNRLQELESSEEELKEETHRLSELLEKERHNGRAREESHMEAIRTLKQEHTKQIESLQSEHAASTSSMTARLAYERAAAERSRAALLQLKTEQEEQAERRLREVTNKFENLKKELAEKEASYEHALSEARSKADWDVMQLRHLLDKADISHANNIEQMTDKYEKEKEDLTEEWSTKLREAEERAAVEADEARRALETTRSKMLAERCELVTKLKEQHRAEMERQWDQFMSDKESCLSRMKSECRQEGEEERVRREKDLMREIAELKSHIHTKSVQFNELEAKAAACGRTLAVTEQELREALQRENEEREKRGEEAEKLKQVEKSSRQQIEHLNRKCACLRKLFDDMRARLAGCERAAEQEARARQKELDYLRAEVTRLTKILVEQSSPRLGARTRADGCENTPKLDESSPCNPSKPEVNAPLRKGEIFL